MRPRTLRELTELARDEMTPSDEERGRVYDSLCAAVAAGAAGAALAATTTAAASSAAGSSAAAQGAAAQSAAAQSAAAQSAAAQSAAASSAAASSAAASSAAAQGAAASSAAAQGAAAQSAGAVVSGAAQAGGAVVSSGLLLKSLVLLVAVGGGAGLLSVTDSPELAHEAAAAEHVQGAPTRDSVRLRPAASEPTETPAEVALALSPSRPETQSAAARRGTLAPALGGAQGRESQRAHPRGPQHRTRDEASVVHDVNTDDEVDLALTQDARRLQRAQQAMARGDGALTLELLAADVDSRLQAERLALRVLARCQVGDEQGARRDAVELRNLPERSSAALARVAHSCVGP